MPSETNKFRVGLFVVVSIVLAVSAVTFWGLIKYARDTRVYVTYFNQSVQGLQVNSVVKYRGVAKGRVGAINLAPDGKLVEVLMHIDRDFVVTTQQIVRLETAGITGIKYLGIELRGDRTDESPKLTFMPEYPVIPSYPSPGVMDLLDMMQKKLTALDMQAISDGITQALFEINTVIARSNWTPVVSNLQKTAASMERMSADIESYFASGKIDKIIDGTVVAVDRARLIAEQIPPEEIEQLTRGVLELVASLNRSAYVAENSIEPLLQELQRTLDNLRSFTEALKDRPSQTLFGRPPAPDGP